MQTLHIGSGGAGSGSGGGGGRSRFDFELTISPQSSLKIEAGGSGTLVCQAIPAKGSTRVDLPRVSWARRDRRPLSPTARDNGRGALTFTRVTRREEGTYICSAGDIRREAVVRIDRGGRGGQGGGRGGDGGRGGGGGRGRGGEGVGGATARPRPDNNNNRGRGKAMEQILKSRIS